VIDSGEHLASHVDDHLVGVAVSHETGKRAPACHAITTRVIDNDEVYAAGFLPFSGYASTGAASDYWFTRSDLCPKAFKDS
jgi:hypothetical protein